MTLKLYELTNQYRLLLDKGVDAETGEIIEINSDELFAHLDEIKESIGDKAGNIGKLYLELQGESKAVVREIDRLEKHKRALLWNADWLKDYLLRELETAGLTEIKRSTIKIAVRTNPPSVNVIDIGAIPEEYKRLIPAFYEANKKEITDYYKETGEIISGTEIIEKRRVDIK